MCILLLEGILAVILYPRNTSFLSLLAIPFHALLTLLLYRGLDAARMVVLALIILQTFTDIPGLFLKTPISPWTNLLSVAHISIQLAVVLLVFNSKAEPWFKYRYNEFPPDHEKETGQSN